MHFVLKRHFGLKTLSFRKFKFDELRVVLKELVFPMILSLTDTKRELQKHVIRVQSVKSNESHHIINETLYFITIVVIGVGFYMLMRVLFTCLMHAGNDRIRKSQWHPSSASFWRIMQDKEMIKK